MIDEKGAVFKHAASYVAKVGYVIGPKTRIPGALVGSGTKTALGIFAYMNRILVIDAEGKLWAHDIGNTVGPAVAIPGMRIMSDRLAIRSAFTVPYKGIMMIDAEGNVYNQKLK